MKILFTLLIAGFPLLLCAQLSNIGDYEVKVSSKNYKTVKGHLKKVNAEGIAVEDYKGNYIIFRTADIEKIKVKKRGVGFFEAVGGGALFGLGLGGAIWSLDKSGENAGDMAKLTVLLTATGAATGTVVGTVSTLTRGKLTLRVNGDTQYFIQHYHLLKKYVNNFEPIQHLSAN
ncbi:hypothetical protein [Nubsella zeaxanthinifaciens]|jgi:hypothetical protein|uniref:hypothetical protein n=1 Tax=Nubsella zeaxanthinifaciens TaxID=392412 RepID=UPI000DE440CC|nr:hypothetical protein [Nubsella zeaxanthinifaciens]